MLRLILGGIIITCIAASTPTHADLFSISPEDFQQSNDIKISTIVHNTPSAVSHSTFTRIHNHNKISDSSAHHALSHSAALSTHLPVASTTAQPTQQVHVAPHQQTPSSAAVYGQQVPLYTTHHYLHAIPTTIAKPVPPATSPATVMAVIKDDTPIVQPLTHTPAHLTFAARPVVYQMLPEIKPVRKISFDESIPSPRNTQNKRKL